MLKNPTALLEAAMIRFYFVAFFFQFVFLFGYRSVCAQTNSASLLFAEDEMLHLTLQTDMRGLLKDRGDDREEHLASISYLENGEEVSQELKVRVRGNFRRQERNCSFPPLRLNFAKKKAIGTLFEGQDKLKLVNPCQRGQSEYEQYIMLEYLIYRMYNELTQYSFKVRLVKMRFEDSNGRGSALESFGFLIEHEDELAERNGANIYDREGLHQEATHRHQMTLLAMFAYMIGNTDWSVPDLHNIRLLSIPDEPLPFAVPYDFDFCGLIETPYALPRAGVPVESVVDRYYLGYCRTEAEMEAAIGVFNEKKDAIFALFDDIELLNRRTTRRGKRFLNEFYSLLENPDKAYRTFNLACIKGG